MNVTNQNVTILLDIVEGSGDIRSPSVPLSCRSSAPVSPHPGRKFATKDRNVSCDPILDGTRNLADQSTYEENYIQLEPFPLETSCQIVDAAISSVDAGVLSPTSITQGNSTDGIDRLVTSPPADEDSRMNETPTMTSDSQTILQPTQLLSTLDIVHPRVLEIHLPTVNKLASSRRSSTWSPRTGPRTTSSRRSSPRPSPSPSIAALISGTSCDLLNPDHSSRCWHCMSAQITAQATALADAIFGPDEHITLAQLDDLAVQTSEDRLPQIGSPYKSAPCTPQMKNTKKLISRSKLFKSPDNIKI